MSHDFKEGDNVTVNCPGHRKDGRTGPVVYNGGGLFATVGVEIDGSNYGFLAFELEHTGETK